MRHWWKWLIGSAGIVSMLLLIGSIQGSDMLSPSKPWISRAEAAMSHVWPQWSKPGSKIVPIVSLGTPGLRLGLAQVSGPSALVGNVKAVLQIDGEYKGVRGKILIPSDSYTDLRRVQGTAVTGLAQYQFLSFASKKKAAPAPVPTAATQRRNDDECEHNCKKHEHHDNGHHYGWYKHGKGKRD